MYSVGLGICRLLPCNASSACLLRTLRQRRQRRVTVWGEVPFDEELLMASLLVVNSPIALGLANFICISVVPYAQETSSDSTFVGSIFGICGWLGSFLSLLRIMDIKCRSNR